VPPRAPESEVAGNCCVIVALEVSVAETLPESEPVIFVDVT
jgi:hypothetical protein